MAIDRNKTWGENVSDGVAGLLAHLQDRYTPGPNEAAGGYAHRAYNNLRGGSAGGPRPTGPTEEEAAALSAMILAEQELAAQQANALAAIPRGMLPPAEEPAAPDDFAAMREAAIRGGTVSSPELQAPESYTGIIRPEETRGQQAPAEMSSVEIPVSQRIAEEIALTRAPEESGQSFVRDPQERGAVADAQPVELPRDEAGARAFMSAHGMAMPKMSPDQIREQLAKQAIYQKADGAKRNAQGAAMRDQNEAAKSTVIGRAMMKAATRDMQLGLITPEQAAAQSQNAAAKLFAGAKLDAEGNPTPEWVASDPQSAKIYSQEKNVRRQLGLEEKRIDTTERIAGTQVKGAENVAKIRAIGQVDAINAGAAGQEAIARINADLGRYGIDQNQLLESEKLVQSGKFNDAQIDNMAKTLGIKRDEIEGNQKLQAAAIAVQQKQIETEAATRIALGESSERVAMEGYKVNREQFGAEYADRAKERALKKIELDRKDYLDKAQLDEYRKNQGFVRESQAKEQEYKREQQKLDNAMMAEKNRLDRITTQIQQVGMIGDIGNRKIEAEARLKQAQIAAEQNKQQQALLGEQIKEKQITNQNLQMQADGAASVDKMFSETEYPDPVARMGAMENWMAKNVDKLASKGGDTIPPIVNSYLEKLYAQEDVYDKSAFTFDDVQFKQHARSKLASILGDEKLATRYIQKYAADNGLFEGGVMHREQFKE